MFVREYFSAICTHGEADTFRVALRELGGVSVAEATEDPIFQA